MTALRRIGWAAGLLSLCACQDAPVQTHVLLEVRVAPALAKQVTRVEVHGQKPGGSRDEGASRSSDYEAGDTLRFVLQPSAAQAQLQVRVVALHDRQPIASAVLRSRYQARRGLYLKVELGCEGERDLGEQRASAAPSAAIDSCKYDAKDKRAAAGAGGSAGRGTLVDPILGGGGTSAAGGGGGRGGAGGAGSGGVEAGSGGAGSGGAEAGGAGAGGMGGAGSGGAEAGSSSSTPGCYSWRRIARIAEVETLMPDAFIAGVEQRENPLEEVQQYICLARPAGMTSKLLGKASKWGCYMPGAGTTAYTVEADVEILISSNNEPCLRWTALEATRQPTSALAFGSPNPTQVCRVFHEEIGEARNTKGPRVGQVRQESGQWVCRYEFYSYLGNPTRVGQPGEVIEVLE